MTLTEVARAVDLPVSTVARLLKTLEQADYLTRRGMGLYHPGTKILEVGARALGRNPLYQLAGPHLMRLSEHTAETAYLAVSDGPERAVYLRQVESGRAIRHAVWTGHSIPVEGTALGAALKGETNKEGFKISRGSPVEPDAAAVAAPVLGSNNLPIAALSVIGPSFRLPDAVLGDYGSVVQQEAYSLSQSLQAASFS